MRDRLCRLVLHSFVLCSVLLSTFLISPPVVQSAGSILRVDSTSSASTPDGSTWANAYGSLHEALAAAESGDQLWVTGGVYLPGSLATDTFFIPSGVAVYGGFQGDETALSQRVPGADPTILSGDIGGDDTFSEGVRVFVGSNARHVVTMNNATGVVLDRLTIQAGNSLSASDGGGVSALASAFSLVDVTVVENRARLGAGVWVSGGAVSVTDCILSANVASSHGGGFYATGTTVQVGRTLFVQNVGSNGGGFYGNGGHADIDRTVFSQNQGSNGGALAAYAASDISIMNSLYYDNHATTNGGGLYTSGSDSMIGIRNSVVTHNSAGSDGGGLGAANSGRFELANVIVWSNTATSGPQMSVGGETGATTEYSIIQGSSTWSHLELGTDSGHNLSANPLLQSDHSLGAGSPAIDAGSNAAVPAGTIADLAGRARIFDGNNDGTATVDIGALEYGAPPVVTLSIGQADVVQGGQVTVPVSIAAQGAQVYGADLTIGYNSTLLTPVSVELGALTAGWSMEQNLASAGQIMVSLAGSQAVQADGEFIRLVFTSTGGTGLASLSWVSAMLNEDEIVAINVDGDVTVHSPVAADFTAEPTSGPASLQVAFTSTSTGDVETYSWDFGDGNTGIGLSTTHTYAEAGTYTVGLTVSGPGGTDTETKTDYITVYAAAEAAFSAAPTSGLAPLEVTFTNNSTGDVSAYAWTFGDGGTSDLPNPTYTYASPGAFTVSLTVSGEGGTSTETQTDLVVVSLGSIAGTVNFWSEARPIGGVPFALSGDATATVSSDGAGVYTVSDLYRGSYTVTPGDRGLFEEAISPLDASMALRDAAGLLSLDGYPLMAADVTLNGSVTAYDASYILRASVGILSYASPGTGGEWVYEPASRAYPAFEGNIADQDYLGVLMGDITGNWGGEVEGQGMSSLPQVVLSLEQAPATADGDVTVRVRLVRAEAPLYSLRLSLSHDAGAALAYCSPGDLTREWMLACNGGEPGRTRVALAGTDAIEVAGILLEFVFHVGDKAGPLTIAPLSVEIDEGAAVALWEPQSEYMYVTYLPLIGR